MASGDTKTNQYLDVAANGTRADLPSDTCCETRSQTLIRGVAERIMDVEDEVERLENNPDVVDIVATYADLQAYDTSQLTDKDVIRVLQDETHDGDSTYYRWNTETQVWTYIGESKQYTAFVGTDGTTAGESGLVPAPAITDAGKYLKADGSWATVSGGIPTNATFWSQTVNNGVVTGDMALGTGSAYTHVIRNHDTVSNYSAIVLANGEAAIAVKTTNLNSAQYRFSGSEAYFSKPLYMTKRNTTAYQQIKNMADPTDPHDATTKNYVDTHAIGTNETLTIATTDWTALAGSTPYTYSATVTVTATIGADSTVSLINDDAVSFATYGFAIGAVDAQNNTVTIYSVGEPSASVSLTINVK